MQEFYLNIIGLSLMADNVLGNFRWDPKIIWGLGFCWIHILENVKGYIVFSCYTKKDGFQFTYIIKYLGSTKIAAPSISIGL